jgi:hypothetical protein
VAGGIVHESNAELRLGRRGKSFEALMGDAGFKNAASEYVILYRVEMSAILCFV